MTTINVKKALQGISDSTGIYKKDIADMIYVSPGCLHMWGIRNRIDLNVVLNICDKLDITINEFIEFGLDDE